MDVRKAVLAFVAVFAAPALSVQGQATPEPLVQELIHADAVYPQERGELQVTVTPRVTRWSGERLEQNAIIAEYGMSDQVQLEASVAGYQYRAARGGNWARGVSAVEIGIRRSWMALGGSATHVALGVGFDIPVRSAGTDEDGEAIAAQPSLVVAHDFARLHGLQLLSNVIIDVPVQGSADPASVSGHLAAVLPVGAVRLLSEISWMPDERPGDERRYVFITPGMVVPVPGGLELAVGLPLRVHHTARRFDIMVNVTYEF